MLYFSLFNLFYIKKIKAPIGDENLFAKVLRKNVTKIKKIKAPIGDENMLQP